MTPVLRILMGSITGALAELAKAPVLEGARLEALQSSLQLMNVALTRGDEAIAALQELSNDVAVMVAAGRNPSDEEWLELRERSWRAHAAIVAGG